jgi:hypothetical protein
MGCFAYSHEKTHMPFIRMMFWIQIKQDRANEIMELQSQISLELVKRK